MLCFSQQIQDRSRISLLHNGCSRQLCFADTDHRLCSPSHLWKHHWSAATSRRGRQARDCKVQVTVQGSHWWGPTDPEELPDPLEMSPVDSLVVPAKQMGCQHLRSCPHKELMHNTQFSLAKNVTLSFQDSYLHHRNVVMQIPKLELKSKYPGTVKLQHIQHEEILQESPSQW